VLARELDDGFECFGLRMTSIGTGERRAQTRSSSRGRAG
jgi:hypothetical protein